MALSYGIGIPILIFEVGIIFLFVYIMKKSYKSRRTSKRFENNFGYFYLDYSDKCYYWEFVRIF